VARDGIEPPTRGFGVPRFEFARVCGRLAILKEVPASSRPIFAIEVNGGSLGVIRLRAVSGEARARRLEFAAAFRHRVHTAQAESKNLPANLIIIPSFAAFAHLGIECDQSQF
jgi:hypothetical protein